MGGLVSGLFGGGQKKAAKINAAAIKDSSEAEAAQAREAARASQMAQETLLGQDRAARAASEILKRPQDQIEVDLVSRGSGDEFDPATGRRRTTRSTYSSARQI